VTGRSNRYVPAPERYGWLNRIVSVGVGERTPGGVSYRVFEVL